MNPPPNVPQLRSLIQTRSRTNIILALGIAKGLGCLDWAREEVWGLRIFERKHIKSPAFCFGFIIMYFYKEYIQFEIYNPNTNDFNGHKKDFLFLGKITNRKERNKSINYCKELVLNTFVEELE